MNIIIIKYIYTIKTYYTFLLQWLLSILFCWISCVSFTINIVNNKEINVIKLMQNYQIKNIIFLQTI